MCHTDFEIILIFELQYSHGVFENHRKTLIQHCELSKLRMHFEWTKVRKNAHFGEFF